MSAAQELLDRLAALGARVKPEGDRLILHAGATAVPAALVAMLRQAKAEVLSTLQVIETGESDDANGIGHRDHREHRKGTSPSPGPMPPVVPMRDGGEDPAVPVSHARAPLAADWRTLFERHVRIRQHRDRHPRAEAERLAWGETVNAWHMAHGQRAPASLCAGCDQPVSGAEVLLLPDGTRVHFSGLDCLVRYGERWRRAATTALVTMGVAPPEEISSEEQH